MNTNHLFRVFVLGIFGFGLRRESHPTVSITLLNQVLGTHVSVSPTLGISLGKVDESERKRFFLTVTYPFF